MSQNEGDDRSIVRRVLQGETDAFELLIRRHSQRLYRVARAILRNDAEAQDATQQACLKAYMHLDQFAGQARFATWLLSIGAREAITESRRRGRAVSIDAEPGPEELETAPSPAPTPEQQALRRELRALIESAIDALPAAYRVVFVLREVEGMNTAQTAECLGITPKAVKTRLYRARGLLRDSLRTQGVVVGMESARAFLFQLSEADRLLSSALHRIRLSMS